MIGFGVLAGLIGLAVLVAMATRQARTQPAAAAHRDLDRRSAVAGQHRRLAVHRDRPPAVARLRPAQDVGRGQPEREQRVRAHDTRSCSPASTACSGSSASASSAGSPLPGRTPRSRRATAMTILRRTRPEPGLRESARHAAGILVRAHRRAVGGLPRPRGFRLRCRACCCRWSARPTPTDGSRSARSARPGTATRSGCSSPAAPRSPLSPSGTRVCSAGSTSPFALLLVGLILRGIGIEYRGKAETAVGRRWCDIAIVVGSFLPAAAARRCVRRLRPRCQDGHRHNMTGGFFDAALAVCAARRGGDAHAVPAARGRVPRVPHRGSGRCPRPRTSLGAIAPVTGVAAVAFLVWTTQVRGGWVSWALAAAIACIFLAGVATLLRSSFGWAFVATSTVCLLVPIWIVRVPVARCAAGPRQVGAVAHGAQRELESLHPGRHDDRRVDLHADRARVPGLDVLGVSRAGRRRERGRGSLRRFGGRSSAAEGGRSGWSRAGPGRVRTVRRFVSRPVDGRLLAVGPCASQVPGDHRIRPDSSP